MFFDDLELSKRSRVQLAELPRTPDTGWRPPTSYPNWQYAIAIGTDFEVKENDFDHGPGWSRGKAQIVGGSLDLLFPDGSTYTEYRPIRHEVGTEFNLPVGPTVAFWKDVLGSNIPKFGANIIYDIGNANDEGIQVNGELHDVEFSESLLDEEGLVNLDYMGQKYLHEGKTSEALYVWCSRAYGGPPTSGQRDNIWRASPLLVGPYACGDANMPRRILEKQYPQLQREGLWNLYRLECSLIPLYVRMRRQGVRVDTKRAEQIYVRLTPLIADLYKQLFEMSGVRAESTTGDDIRKIGKALGLTPPLTENGNPSYNKEYLNELDHPVATLILQIRQMETIQNTFLRNYILGSHINGIVHGEFHPLRNDEGGTKTGRLSSANPNLQNIPVRTKLGKEIRACFVPFEHHLSWMKGDFSQIQYRGLAHYAVGQGSDELRAAYVSNPKTDYHDTTQARIKSVVGIEVPRKPVKNLNFASMFGAGKKKVKRMIQLDSDIEITDKLAETFYVSHHQANPYLKATIDAMSNEAMRTGYNASLLGRRMRFNYWEPQFIEDFSNRKRPLPYQQAIREYGQVKRSGTYRAISGKLQGFEADIMKSAMAKALKDGVYDVIGVPVSLVHDEKNFSKIDDSPAQREAYAYMKWVMENTLRVRVPIIFEMAEGPNWGAIE